MIEMGIVFDREVQPLYLTSRLRIKDFVDGALAIPCISARY